MKLSVIIVSYKVKYYVEQCLIALKKATLGIDTEIFVVDNHSDDGSVEYLSGRFPDITLVNSSHNLGFSRANNVAIRQCSGEYVLLLNPDTVVGESTIRTVVDFMDAHPKAGGAGVTMLNDDGTKARESRRGVPSISTAFYKMSGLCSCYPHSRRFARYYMGHLPWDKPSRIEIISGAFCMLRHSALDKVGLLDEDFFMYGEDVDLSYRLLKGGYENWFVPVEMLHYKGESAHKSSFRYVHVFYNAMLIFFRKHYGNFAAVVSLPIKAAIILKATLTLVKMQVASVRKSLGFFSPSGEAEASYVFIGAAGSLDECRKICRRRGITGEFVEGDSNTLPHGHRDMDLAASKPVYVVYDTSSYSYEDILGVFSADSRPNVFIGTFCPHTNIIVTGKDILK